MPCFTVLVLVFREDPKHLSAPLGLHERMHVLRGHEEHCGPSRYSVGFATEVNEGIEARLTWRHKKNSRANVPFPVAFRRIAFARPPGPTRCLDLDGHGAAACIVADHEVNGWRTATSEGDSVPHRGQAVGNEVLPRSAGEGRVRSGHAPPTFRGSWMEYTNTRRHRFLLIRTSGTCYRQSRADGNRLGCVNNFSHRGLSHRTRSVFRLQCAHAFRWGCWNSQSHRTRSCSTDTCSCYSP